ncbi:reverse transcriptase domain-containing protein [Artemisia annua]|uniref:Reverse transcriptase domain-containing protein n=1 Tax=Artemisia annua TaxID=35608 RepID=A0A2U1KY59_ARTAN|nr:reverse transcriptase domain-containing protein [Artemisia annua]
MFGAAPRKPGSNHDHRLLTDRSEKAHLMKASRETPRGIQTQPDLDDIPQQAKHKTSKERKNIGEKRKVEHSQGAIKPDNPEGKRLKLQGESCPKKEGYAATPSQKRCKRQRRGNIARPESNYEEPRKEKSQLTHAPHDEVSGEMGDDQMQPYVPEEIEPFTENIRNIKLPKKTHMPDNVQSYDGNENPVDHIRVFQMAARVYNWDKATQCRMFQLTLTGAARVWFKNIPRESISSYCELRDAFLETFLSMERHKQKNQKIHCTKRSNKESIEDFTRRFIMENRKAKEVPEAVKIVKFVKKVSNPGLIEYLHREIPESV